MVLIIHAVFVFHLASADTLPGEAKQWKIFGSQLVTLETEVANFENDIA